MITKEQAIVGRSFHRGPCSVTVGPHGGTTHRTKHWRANGACKTWKTRPDEFSLPLKYGMYGPFGYLTPANAAEFHRPEDCQPIVTVKGSK